MNYCGLTTPGTDVFSIGKFIESLTHSWCMSKQYITVIRRPYTHTIVWVKFSSSQPLIILEFSHLHVSISSSVHPTSLRFFIMPSYKSIVESAYVTYPLTTPCHCYEILSTSPALTSFHISSLYTAGWKKLGPSVLLLWIAGGWYLLVCAGSD